MKALRAIVYIVSAAVSMCVASCADTQLAHAVSRTNASCPIEVAAGVRLDSVWVAGDEVNYHYTVDGNIYRIKDLADDYRRFGATQMVGEKFRNDQYVSQFIDIVKANDMNLRLIFADSTGRRVEKRIVLEGI